MDIGVLLESPQGSQSSSRMRACTCGFLQGGSSSVTHSARGSKDLWFSHEAFPRGFPTGLFHVHTWWESILGLNVKASRENRFLWNGLAHLGTLGMVARPWSSSRLSCGERLLLRCDGNARNSFPTKQRKDPPSRARRRKRGSPGCVRDPRDSSRVETGMSGNFLSCSKGVKDPLEVPVLRCD